MVFPSHALRAYFRSGWAFLIPYLAAYLLYAWLGWPVNALGAGSAASAAGFPAPPLLQVYWFLHAANLVLAGLALGSWWRESPTPSSPASRLWPLLPWLCLALLFCIPGLYLEFPADPWEHYARINEWSWLQTVTAHSTWSKSSYFLAYSVAGSIAPPAVQLGWLNLYYTACCLLLCWQYFRLAGAAGLGTRGAFLFVLLQYATFGNHLFDFYRYYGMSSTVFAQIGAIALVRLALETFSSAAPGDTARLTSRALVPGALLLGVVACNHLQGIGVAAIGVISVAVWRAARKPALLGGIALGAVILSILAVFLWPRPPAFESIARQAGWLHAGYGFNFFSPSSPAFAPVWSVLGGWGLANLAAAVVLLRRNHPAAWLTLVPFALLSLPIVTIPLASALMAHSSMPDGHLIVFSRMLFAIPSGLALVAVIATWGSRKTGEQPATPVGTTLKPESSFAAGGWWVFYAAVLALVLMPAGKPYYNRLFHALMVPPADLAMRHVLASPAARPPGNRTPLASLPGSRAAPLLLQQGGLLVPPGIAYVLNASGSTLIAGEKRRLLWPTLTAPSLAIGTLRENLAFAESTGVRPLPFSPAPSLFSARSQTGELSGHWLANDVALQHAGQPELFAPPPASQPQRPPQLWLDWTDAQARTHTDGPGESLGAADRPTLIRDLPAGEIRAGDEVGWHLFLRSPDGNAQRLTLVLRGPDFHQRHEFSGRATPLGGAGYVSGSVTARFPTPGDYTAELAGETLWPEETRQVRYRFTVKPR